MKALFKKIMILFMWYPFRIFVRIIPLYLTYLMGMIGGYLLYVISREKHKIIAEELSCIMPEKNQTEINKIIRGSFVNYCLSEIEVLLYPVMNRKFIAKNVVIEGKEHLDNALSKGKGVLLFQAHFGAFQMTMPAIGYSGYKMNQISVSASEWKKGTSSGIQRRFFDIKAKYEYALPVNHISVKSTLRPVFKALERNEIVGVTADGGGGKKIIPIKFIGRDANLQQGAVDLALRTGAGVIPAFIITEKGLKHRLIIHPQIDIDEKLSKEENIKKVLQKFAGMLEKYVYRYPTHYGYTLYLRKSRVSLDSYPFFEDYRVSQNNNIDHKVADYA